MDIEQLFSIRGKVALIAGGAGDRGIGEMIARAYVAAGAKVYIASRKVEAGDALAAELSALGSCTSLQADLGQPDGATQLAATMAEREPELDVLVNNAGASWGAPFDDDPVAGFDKVMNVNVRGVFLLTQALAPQLRVAASAEDPARVIDIGSIDGIHVPDLPTYAYSASKAAVHQLTRHLAKELVTDHITVNAIAPGLFPSKLTEVLFEHEAALIESIPMGRVGQPEDIAGLAIHLASRAGAYMTGAVMPVDGGVATLK